MQSKDIVMQVSEETAEVMEEISEQLFEESEARFDEIVEAIGEAVKKIENLYTEFMGFTGNSSKLTESNQMEIIHKFTDVLNNIGEFKKDVEEQTVQSNEKIRRLITVMTDVPQLIQNVSNCINESETTREKFEDALFQSVNSLVQNIAELQKIQCNIIDKLNADDSDEKLTSTLNKLSTLEKEILQTKDDIGNVSNAVFNCSELIERILSAVTYLQENDKNIIELGGENIKKVDKLDKQIEDKVVLLLEKMADISTQIDALSHNVQYISKKQDELDKDVKYLKLPFFKKWFAKG